MFIEAILDGKHELSPMSKEGWNLYSKCGKEQKGSTDPVSKKRTHINADIDRDFPTSILKSIPLKNSILSSAWVGQMHGENAVFSSTGYPPVQ